MARKRPVRSMATSSARRVLPSGSTTSSPPSPPHPGGRSGRRPEASRGEPAAGSDTNFEKRGSVVGPRQGTADADALARQLEAGRATACLATPHRRHRRARRPPEPAHRARRDATSKRRLGADVLADIRAGRGGRLPAVPFNKTRASAIRVTRTPASFWISLGNPEPQLGGSKRLTILLVGPWSVIPVDPFVRLFCLCGSDPSLLIWRGIFPGEKAPSPPPAKEGKGAAAGAHSVVRPASRGVFERSRVGAPSHPRKGVAVARIRRRNSRRGPGRAAGDPWGLRNVRRGVPALETHPRGASLATHRDLGLRARD